MQFKQDFQILHVVFLSLLMFNCSATHKIATKDSYAFELFFGNTGGFSNINPVFVVKNNGEVLKMDNSSSNPYLLKHIDISKIDSLYKLIRESNLCNLKIKQVSNFNNYIEIKSAGCNNKVMWYNDSQITFELNILYSFLLGIVKK
jgi:hypothetical protein